MNKFFKFMAIASLAVSVTSCGDDEPSSEIRKEFDPVTNYVYTINTATGDTLLTDGCSIALTFDSDGKASVRLDAVNIGDKSIGIDCADVEWTINRDNGSRSIYVAQLPARTTGYQTATVTDFTVSYLDRVYDNTEIPAYQITMTVDGSCKVRVMQRMVYSFGETVVTTMRNGAKYQTDDTYYGVSFDRTKMTSSIVMYNAKFAENMPTQKALTIPDVPFKLSADGFTLAVDSVTPLAPPPASVPMPEMKVTDLSATGVYGGRQSLKFNVAGAWLLEAVLSEDGMIGDN